MKRSGVSIERSRSSPNFAAGISNKIFHLDFAAIGFEKQQDARKDWWCHIGSKIAAGSNLQHRNGCDPGRRIVLGYVSSDFRQHSAAAAVKPILRHHDKARFQVICYSCSIAEDEVTADFQRLAHTWRNVSQFSDDRLAEQIRDDKVDILIDLSGHSAGNRLGVFARKPAPIQVTAWGHAAGTGLPTIDYLFSDAVAIPSAVRRLLSEDLRSSLSGNDRSSARCVTQLGRSGSVESVRYVRRLQSRQQNLRRCSWRLGTDSSCNAALQIADKRRRPRQRVCARSIEGKIRHL